MTTSTASALSASSSRSAETQRPADGDAAAPTDASPARTAPTLDINCDMGESFGAFVMGNDLEVLAHVTSANIACGMHAGDPGVMHRTVEAAVERGVAVGAHPGLPDLQGFGRRVMALSPAEVYDLTVYQIGALWAFTRAAGTTLHHVKAHGALYNMTAKDPAIADAVARATRDVDPSLIVYVATSTMADAATALGLPVAYEVFADRTYQDDATLTPRSQADAMIEDPDLSIAQVKGMVVGGYVTSQTGKRVPVRADTLCIHGDQPGAAVFARRIREALTHDGIRIATI
ncbi:LamB/YcsF family protein [Schauerella aestuarii]|uniref:LamB/YcsF family protein n=1 Tax=Schauerella aestuarii TaxID=2511204 RepID=UPI00136FAC15|nr:5-oxoprolinase subunit PxpA [Achromobacter aestuarii]MYZ44543.1 LamB/YcsF family protein [Achromobacter aestuarii]